MRRQAIFILIAIFLFAVTTVSAQNDYFHNKLVRKGFDIVNVENSGLMQFLDDESYDDPDLTSLYNYSIISKFSRGVPSKPAGIVLRWDSITPVEEIASVVVTLIESDIEKGVSTYDPKKANERVKYYYPDIDTREYLLCNMRPKKYCYYKVEEVLHNGKRILLKKGKFYTDGCIRMLRVEGMANVRDFGGWLTSFGEPVVYGRIFRGNRPDGITETGKNDFVKNEHITADLDLRGTNLGQSPLGPLDVVEYYCTNNARYKQALTGNTAVLVRDLDIIASVLRKGGNLFLHCNHGVNRAGTLSFLIEGILGFSEADLSRDYELSSFAYTGITRSKIYAAMLTVIRSYGEGDDDLAQCFYNFALSIGASEETLDTIRCVMLGIPPNDRRILNAHRNN